MGSKDQDYVHEIANLIREGKILFFVGSGISREKPTYFPTGETLRNELIESFCFDQKNDIKKYLLNAVEKITLEEVSQVIYEHIDDRLLNLLSIILDDQKVQPNNIHQFLAKSLTYGNVVVTTNYDSMIERAYIENVPKEIQKEKALWINYDDPHFDEFYDYMQNIVVSKKDTMWFSAILKLHGTLQDIKSKRNTKDSVITILSRIESLSLPKKKALKNLFDDYHVISMGYSARDLDIFECLSEITSRREDLTLKWNLDTSETISDLYRITSIGRGMNKKKIFWIKYYPEQEPKILTYKNIKDESKKRTDWETLNTNRILLNRCIYGTDLGIKIKQAAIKFVEAVANRLKKIDDKHFWILPKQQDTLDEQHLKSYRKDRLIELANTVPKYNRMLILADIAEKTRVWGIAKQFCKEAQLLDINLKSIAEIERRLGWYFYQLNREGDAGTALYHYELSHSSYQLLGDKFEEARLKSSLGLLYNRRQRELGKKELDTAKTYVERAWDVLKPILDPTHTITEYNITSKDEIDQVVDKMINLSRYLTVEQKRILAKVWGGIAHVYLRLSGDPGGVIVRKGRPEIEEDEENRQLLYKAVIFLKATRQLEKEVGAIRDLIQTDHLIGLTLTRLGKAGEAFKFHENWTRKTGLLGWKHEYAQACRNLSVAYAYKEDGESKKWIEEAIKTWKNLQKITSEDRTTDIEAAKKLKKKISNLIKKYQLENELGKVNDYIND